MDSEGVCIYSQKKILNWSIIINRLLDIFYGDIDNVKREKKGSKLKEAKISESICRE